jgi:hypothetical protein
MLSTLFNTAGDSINKSPPPEGTDIPAPVLPFNVALIVPPLIVTDLPWMAEVALVLSTETLALISKASPA